MGKLVVRHEAKRSVVRDTTPLSSVTHYEWSTSGIEVPGHAFRCCNPGKSSSDPKIKIAEALYERGMLSDAEQRYLSVLQGENWDGNGAVVVVGLAQCMLARDEFGRALDYFEQALEISAGSFQVYEGLAVCQERLGNHKAVVENCQRAFECGGCDSADLFRMQGIALLNLGRKKEGRKSLEKALDPELAESRVEHCMRAGEVCKRHGLYALALHHFEAASMADPLDANAYLHRGDCAERLRRYQEAINMYIAAIHTAGSIHARSLSRKRIDLREAYALLGRAFEKFGWLPSAEEMWKRAKDAAANHVKARAGSSGMPGSEGKSRHERFGVYESCDG